MHTVLQTVVSVLAFVIGAKRLVRSREVFCHTPVWSVDGSRHMANIAGMAVNMVGVIWAASPLRTLAPVEGLWFNLVMLLCYAYYGYGPSTPSHDLVPHASPLHQ